MRKRALPIVVLGLILLAQAVRADWGSVARISRTSGESREPKVAAGASGVHVVWYDDTPGNYEIYYKSSTDGGATWRPAKRLTWTSADSQFPDIAVDSSGNVHVVWDESSAGGWGIFHKKSTDGGTTWGASQTLVWNSDGAFCPSLAAGPSNRLHLAWQGYNSGNGEIYYKKSTNGGTSWGESQRLTWNSGSSGYPSIGCISSANSHVVWEDDTPGGYDALYKRSTDGGAGWTATQNISATSGWSSYPVLAVGPSGNIHVAWGDGTYGNSEILYRKSTNQGAAWTPKRRLSWNSGISDYTSIAADSSGGVHVVWSDNTLGNFEIYARQSTDGGTTWTSVQRLTWNTGSSSPSAVSVDSSGNLHVVWSDNTPGNIEVYYRKFSK